MLSLLKKPISTIFEHKASMHQICHKRSHYHCGIFNDQNAWSSASSLGMNSSMFTNCSVFCVVQPVWSSAWAKMWCSEVFAVRSCCYVTRLVLELTLWCSQTVWFFVMYNMFKVWFWATMWCSESSIFWHSMFGVFKVWYFGVCSKTASIIDL